MYLNPLSLSLYHCTSVLISVIIDWACALAHTKWLYYVILSWMQMWNKLQLPHACPAPWESFGRETSHRGDICIRLVIAPHSSKCFRCDHCLVLSVSVEVSVCVSVCVCVCVWVRHVLRLLQPWQLVNKHRPVNSCWWCNVELLLTLLILPPHPASLTPSTNPPFYLQVSLGVDADFQQRQHRECVCACVCVWGCGCVCLCATSPCKVLQRDLRQHVFSCHQRKFHIIRLSSEPKHLWESGNWRAGSRPVEWRGSGRRRVSLVSCLFVFWPSGRWTVCAEFHGC